MANFAKNVTFSAVDLYHLTESAPDLAGTLLRSVMDLISQGTIECPSPIHVYPIAKAEEAFRYLQSGKNTGRTILNVDQSSFVEVRYIHDFVANC